MAFLLLLTGGLRAERQGRLVCGHLQLDGGMEMKDESIKSPQRYLLLRLCLSSDSASPASAFLGSTSSGPELPIVPSDCHFSFPERLSVVLFLLREDALS